MTKRPGFREGEQQEIISPEVSTTLSERVFQLEFFNNNISSGLNTVGLITNNNSEFDLFVKGIRCQAVDISNLVVFCSSSNFWSLNFDGSLDSGGTSVSPLNLKSNGGTSPDIDSYQGPLDLTGSTREIDRFYPMAKDQFTYSSHAPILLTTGNSFSISLETTSSTGQAFACVTYQMVKKQ